MLVALGAIAGQSLFGGSLRVGAARGQELRLGSRPVIATIHPPVRRVHARRSDEREDTYQRLVSDLRRAGRLAG